MSMKGRKGIVPKMRTGNILYSDDLCMKMRASYADAGREVYPYHNDHVPAVVHVECLLSWLVFRYGAERTATSRRSRKHFDHVEMDRTNSDPSGTVVAFQSSRVCSYY